MAARYDTAQEVSFFAVSDLTRCGHTPSADSSMVGALDCDQDCNHLPADLSTLPNLLGSILRNCRSKFEPVEFHFGVFVPARRVDEHSVQSICFHLLFEPGCIYRKSLNCVVAFSFSIM